METKTCSSCKIEKEYSYFNKNKTQKDGHHNQCKTCRGEYNTKTKDLIKIKNNKYWVDNKERLKEQHEEWLLNNPEYTKEYNKNYRKILGNLEKEKLRLIKYRENHSEEIKKQQKEWRKNNPDYIKEYSEIYRKNNKDKISLCFKKRYSSDKLFRLRCKITTTIREMLKKIGSTKNGKRTQEILGCGIEYANSFIENQWSLPHNLNENGQVWMSWANHGKYNKGVFNCGWDIDHRIPLSSAKTEEELLKLFHYSNLQPLCSKINRDIKRDNY